MFALLFAMAAAAAYWVYVNHEPNKIAPVFDPHGEAASVKYNNM